MILRKAIILSTAIALSGLAYAGGDKASTADKIKMLDSDGDGQVSATEYTAKSGKIQADFDSMDADKDGFATTAEMDAHKAMKRDDTNQMDKPMRSDTSAPTKTP